LAESSFSGEVEFGRHFSRDAAGRWVCVEACEIQLPAGRIQFAPGTTLVRGAGFMDVDIAELLDAQYDVRNTEQPGEQ